MKKKKDWKVNLCSGCLLQFRISSARLRLKISLYDEKMSNRERSSHDDKQDDERRNRDKANMKRTLEKKTKWHTM